MNPGNRQRVLMTAVILTVLVLSSGSLWAATTGQLSGYVVDNDGAPLPGVSVSASSPTQIGGVHATETDVQGWFQYPRLNPGFFIVRLELDGFLTQELTEVQVRLDRTTQVHVTMPLATFGEGVTVTETTPVIDPQQVSTGQVFSSDYLQDAGVGMGIRSYPWEVIGTAAGTERQHVLGSTSQENLYLIDGLDTTHPYWGRAGSWITLDAVQEITLDSGGFGAEYGRATGGVVNMLTKSGSNTLSGSLDLRYTDNNLESGGEHYDPEEATSSYRMATATLGGRLLRDRVWFFGSLQDEAVQETPSGALTTTEISWKQIFAKVTGQVTPRWLVLGKYYWGPEDVENGWSSPFVLPEADGRSSFEGSILQAEVSGVLTDGLLWEMQIGSNWDEGNWGPMSGDNSLIQHYSLATGIRSGNFLTLNYDSTRRNQVGTSLSWFVDDFLGSHDIRLGGEYHQTSLEKSSCYTGIQDGGICRQGVEGYWFGDWEDSDSVMPYVMETLDPTGPFEVSGEQPSMFIQDSWRVRPNVTLQVGLRWDRSTYENDVGQRVADLDMLQPRVGATWDITRNGRNILRASWGRFMHPGLLYMPRLATVATEYWEGWFSCSLPPEYDGYGLTDPAECAAVAESWGIPYRSDPEGWDPAGWLFDYSVGSDPSLIADDLSPQYGETVIVGFERELFRRTSLELSFVDKPTRDVLDDTCVENYPTPTPGIECSAFIIANLPQARRDYRAWLLNFESRAIDRLHVLASYTYSDTKGSTGSNVAAWEFDQYPYHYVNTYGYLWYHRQHQVKINGYTRLPWDIGVGFNGRWTSPFRWTPRERGRRVDRGVFHPVFLEPRGSREGDSWSQLDVQLTKGFNLGPTRLQLIGAVLNLFDSENAINVCDNVNGCGDFELGDPTAWQLPRRYELGVRVDF